MTLFTAVFLACVFQKPNIACGIQVGKSYATMEKCEEDTINKAASINTIPGAHRIALMPGLICVKSEKKGA